MASPLRARNAIFALFVIAAIAAVALAYRYKQSKTDEKNSTTTVAKKDDAPTKAWLAGEVPPEALRGRPVSGGTLTVRLPAEPGMLNRLHESGQDAWGVRTMFGTVLETLCDLDRDTAPAYRLKPMLAQRWEISPDGLTTTFHLRQGVTFHNGEPFTAKDVKAVLDAINDPKNPTSRMRSYLEALGSYETPDDYTLVLAWKKPHFLGTRHIATLIPIVPASALKGDFQALAINRAPIGTGPFKFAGWETGTAITLEKNPNYWGEPAHLDRIVFRIVKDHTVATQMFERGEFDLMTTVLPTVWRDLEKPDPKNAWAWRDYHRILFAENAYNWIGWNEARPFFADAQVRRALGHLIPYEAIERSIYLDLEPMTTCPFYSKGAYCDPALEAGDSQERIRYDPKKAQALLEAAGWKDTNGDGLRDKGGVPFKFTFITYAHSVNVGKLAPILQSEFQKVGLGLDIERVDWAVFTERLRRHDFDMASLGWATLDVEDDVFFNFHSSQVEDGTNYVGYKNAELDRLLEESRAEYDETRRIDLNRKIHRIVYGEQVYAFLGRRSALDFTKRSVRGIKPAINWYRLADAWIAPPEN